MAGIRRVRVAAAIGLIVLLGAGWLLTTRAGESRRAAAPAGADAKLAPTAPAQPAGRGALRALVPSGLTCEHAAATAAHLRCHGSGVEVEYRLVAMQALDSVYLDASGSTATSPTSRSPASGVVGCLRNVPDERAWSRPSTPRRAVGRFACGVVRGRAAMWWTVAGRGLLAHAVARNGDLAPLFRWWLAHSER